MHALTALVIFGGIQSIARVCEKLVPFMAAFLCGRMYRDSGESIWILLASGTENDLYAGIPAGRSSRWAYGRRHYAGIALWSCKRSVLQ